LSDKLLSIVLPVYNGDKFLKETIASIMHQSFSNFSLIIIDDGSTDNTEKVIKTFCDERILSYKIEHGGIIASFNYGLSKVNTKYVARIDADDIYFVNKFMKQINFLEKNNEVVLIGTNANYMSENGKISKIMINVPSDHETILNNLFKKKRAIIQSTIVARADILKKIGGYRENVYPEDYDLFFRISEIGKIHNLDESLASIRIHKSFSHYNLNLLIKNHQKLIESYNVKNNIQKNKVSSFASIYLNRIGLYYYLNGNKIMALFILLISLILSPISTFKSIYNKLHK
jgi:glycosyltransferase involved in cell wall biosynthesis